MSEKTIEEQRHEFMVSLATPKRLEGFFLKVELPRDSSGVLYNKAIPLFLSKMNGKYMCKNNDNDPLRIISVEFVKEHSILEKDVEGWLKENDKIDEIRKQEGI